LKSDRVVQMESPPPPQGHLRKIEKLSFASNALCFDSHSSIRTIGMAENALPEVALNPVPRGLFVKGEKGKRCA
jgi:hypothetical protein